MKILTECIFLSTVKSPGYLPKFILICFEVQGNLPTKDSRHSSVKRDLHYPSAFQLYTSGRAVRPYERSINCKICIDKSDNTWQTRHRAATLPCISES